jgi:hypothetical protein
LEVMAERPLALHECDLPMVISSLLAKDAAAGAGLTLYLLGSQPMSAASPEEAAMTGSETGQVTGTKDKDYDIIWFTEACLSNALRLETYIQDAEREGDTELATFFRKAQAESRKGAEQGKQLLRKRLGS